MTTRQGQDSSDDRSPDGDSSEAASATTSSAPPPADWLADFELGAPLDAHTHTETFRARRRHDDRAVVLRIAKAPRRSFAAVRRALGRERDVLRGVDHPAIPALLDVVDAEREFALVIEDHGGHRLDAVLDRLPRIAPLPALAIALEVADALAAIHRLDEPHGSLRPELVELTEQGMVYVHGVGQHYMHELRGAEESLALPDHMSPEQILGDPPDDQSDVFLFGMLLHQMMAGQPPFFPEASGVSHQIRHQKPEPLSRLVEDLPDGLERVVARCLEKRPRDRYPDMASVGSELVRILRRRTALPRDLLVTRALADAGLAVELSPPRERGVERGTSRNIPWRRYLLPVALTTGIALIGVVAWRSLGDEQSSGPTDARGIVKRPAQVQVLARPWAEVHLDGARTDVTPIGRPIEVSPGRHVFVFKHPHAPDETRTIEIIAGQTILLDVAMTVTRPYDAGPEGGGGADAAPPSP